MTTKEYEALIDKLVQQENDRVYCDLLDIGLNPDDAYRAAFEEESDEVLDSVADLLDELNAIIDGFDLSDIDQ